MAGKKKEREKMKSFKLTVSVSGYLKEGDSKSFDLDESETRIECVKKLEAVALEFLHQSFYENARIALDKFSKKEEDYNRE